MSSRKVNNLQDINAANNSTPEQVAQGRAKAWVRFNGTGTVSITDSFNISSITDNGTGSYGFDFTTNMANANYIALSNTARFSSVGSMTTSSFSVIVSNINGNSEDRATIHAVIFGDQ